jgi:hypothetical protein
VFTILEINLEIKPATVAEGSEACTAFDWSEVGIVGSIPHKAWMFGVYTFILCLGRGLVTR